jgi:hypothetical protein
MDGMVSFKFVRQVIHEWREHGRTKVARSQIAFDTMKGTTLNRVTRRIHMIKGLGPSCVWRIHTMCYLIGTSSIDKGKGKTLANEVWNIIHGVDVLLKELFPQEEGSTRSTKIHSEVLLLMFSLML